MTEKDRNLNRAIFIDRLKQHCESVKAEDTDISESKFHSGFKAGEKSEVDHILSFIKGFKASLTGNEKQVIELLRQSLDERAEHDCDYEEYYGRDGCPEVITRHHYRCDGCKARELIKEIETLENSEEQKVGERELTELEKRVGRSKNYHTKSAREQWAEDKRKGILDWNGSSKWLDNHGK